MYHDFKAQLPQECMQLNTEGDDTFRARDGKFPKTLSTQLWTMKLKLMNV